jgi:hypothetical protein
VAASDAKSQVTFQYDDGKIVGIDAVVLSTQHSEDISLKDLQEAVMEEIIKPVLPAEWLSASTKYHINPTGRFVIGGPMGDCGLTGRKIIVDTYGGMARHGGGAFSGKDPSKVDRSAAYAARYVAKNIVAAGLADRCEIQVSYAIGVAEPTSIMVETFGTEKVPTEQLTLLVREFFDLRPYGLIQMMVCCSRSTAKLQLTVTSARALPLGSDRQSRIAARCCRPEISLRIECENGKPWLAVFVFSGWVLVDPGSNNQQAGAILPPLGCLTFWIRKPEWPQLPCCPIGSAAHKVCCVLSMPVILQWHK